MGDIEAALGHAQLASRQLARSEHAAAFESLSTALRLAPQLDLLWAQFADLIRHFNLRHPVPDEVRELLARALEHPAVDPGDLVRPISTLALSRGATAVLDEPLLLRLLEDAVIRDAALERLIVETRARMLDEALDPAVQVAIAQQCFNTEYVFDETPQERAKLARLHEELASAKPAPLHRYAAYAAYRPLSALPGIDLQGTELATLHRRQIAEPLQEQALRAQIPARGATASAVSAAVRAQYEENPYPRWVRIASRFARADTSRVAKSPRVLVAGCGTGQQAITTARQLEGASILAVDLSLASLGYAKRKTLELGIRNIEYLQADILGLEGLDERFDLIECSGVLHHLENPFEGWRVLAGLRKPGGLMRVGLYSEAGRRSVVRARELIAAQGFTPDPEGIRACRAAIRARPDDELLGKIARNEDFYSMSGCRDLLFHVQEQRFTLPQIESMIARLNLEFLGFEFADSGATLQRYRARFPADSDLVHLGKWHRFEQEFPDSFARMYQFWVRGNN